MGALTLFGFLAVATLGQAQAPRSSPGTPPPPGSSASPASAPKATASPTPITDVSMRVKSYQIFLRDLTRGQTEDGRPKVLLKERITSDGRLGLAETDRAHLQAQREAFDKAPFVTLADPALRDLVRKSLDDLVGEETTPAGATDPSARSEAARQRIKVKTDRLESLLDTVAVALDEAQAKVGVKEELPRFRLPGAKAVPGPAAADTDVIRISAPRPAAQVPEALADADSAPCLDMGRRERDLRDRTREKRTPVRDLVNAGDRASARGYNDEARQAYERAAEVTNDLLREWQGMLKDMLQEVSGDAGLRPECTQIISRVVSNTIDLNDQLKQLYPKLGSVYFALEQYDQASAEIRKSVKIDPLDPKAWDILGKVELKLDNFDEAARCFTNSTRLDTYQPEVYFHLAKALAKKGETQRSIFYLRRAVSRGFSRFADIDQDADFDNLRGDKGFEELVYQSVGTPR